MNIISKYPWATVSRLVLPLLTLILLFATSCSYEQILTPGVEEQETLVTLSLNVPDATRALTTTEEEAVKIVHVLAFKDGIYKYSASSNNTTDHKTFKITLRKGTWDLVVFANASSAMTGLTVGASQTDLLNGLTKSISVAEGWKITDLRTTGIPMSSKLLANKVIDDNTVIGTSGNGNGIALYRMVAKADVAIASTAQAKFKLASVRVYNYNSKGRVHPNATNVKAINLPSVPVKIKGNTDADKLRYAATSETACTREIYLNESSNPIDLSGMSLEDRTCLVVGGRYGTDSDPTYYRVDFSRVNGNKDDYLDIIRNHHYTFNITKVDGRGYGDENTAFESRPSNMTVEVTPWNQEAINEIITDGQYGLGVNRKAFTFFKDLLSDQIVGGVNQLLALTDYEGNWTVTVKNSDNTTDASASTNASWLTVKAQSGGSAAYSVTVTGDTQQRFFIFATKNTGSTERTAYIHVKVKKLVQVIKITQTTQAKTSLMLKSGADEVTELVWDNRNPNATHSLMAIWNPVDKQCAIKKINTANREFRYELPATGLGTITTAGGNQIYDIKPQPITVDDPNYPFVDRSSVETFTITYEETTISKSVILRQKNYALLTAGFAASVVAGVPKTATIRCNTDWTVTATYGEGLAAGAVAFTLEGVANTAEGSDNFSFRFADEKYGKVTFQFSPKIAGLFTPVTVSVVSKKTAPPSFPAYPGVIGYDPDTETLNLNGKGVMVYFKYGGIIAMYAGLNGDTWKTDGSPIAFNPTDISVGAYNSFPIPVKTDNSTIGPIDVPLTVAEALNGNGDPCRFINSDGSGMTAAEVKAALATNTLPYKTYWKLPTNAQNKQLADAGSSWTTRAATAAGDATLRNGRTFTALDRFTFGNFLPAGGCRSNGSGTVSSQGTRGIYWSSTPDATYGYYLIFTNSSAYPDNFHQSYGYAVRCVSQP